MTAIYTDQKNTSTHRGTERACRRWAAEQLGVSSLRGLAQAPTERGTRIYGRGADDEGESVELVW